ncbi:chromosome 19 open reading frame 34 [Homo sapiens]
MGLAASGAKEKHPTNQGEEGSRPPHGRKLRSERQGWAGPVLGALQTPDQGRLSSPREGPVHGRSQPHRADCTGDAHEDSRPLRTQLSRHRSPSAKARVQIMQTEARLPWTPEPQTPSTKAKWTHLHQIHHKDGLPDSGGNGVSLCHPDWSAFSPHRVGAAGRHPAPVSLHSKAVTSVASSCLCDDPHEGCRVKGTAGFGLTPRGALGERAWSWGAAQVFYIPWPPSSPARLSSWPCAPGDAC